MRGFQKKKKKKEIERLSLSVLGYHRNEMNPTVGCGWCLSRQSDRHAVDGGGQWPWVVGDFIHSTRQLTLSLSLCAACLWVCAGLKVSLHSLLYSFQSERGEDRPVMDVSSPRPVSFWGLLLISSLSARSMLLIEC